MAGNDPLNALCWSSLGGTLIELGKLATGREALNRSLEINPEQSYALWYTSLSFLLERRPADALAAAQRSSSEAYRLTSAAVAQHDLWHAKESQLALDELIAKGPQCRLPDRGGLRMGRREGTPSGGWRERAHSATAGSPMKVDPMLRGLRSDPRWGPLLASVNLVAD